MKKRMMHTAFAAIALTILGACSTSQHVNNGGLLVKRKHNKGFYLNKSNAGDELAKKNVEKQLVFESSVESTPTPLRLSEERMTSTVRTNDVAVEEINVPSPSTDGFSSSTPQHTPKIGSTTSVQTEEVEKSTSVTETYISKKDVRKALKQEKKSTRADTVLLVILAILLPPLAVYLHQGEWNGKCWLNLILTLLCGLPGVIHALIVVLK